MRFTLTLTLAVAAAVTKMVGAAPIPIFRDLQFDRERHLSQLTSLRLAVLTTSLLH